MYWKKSQKVFFITQRLIFLQKSNFNFFKNKNSKLKWKSMIVRMLLFLPVYVVNDTNVWRGNDCLRFNWRWAEFFEDLWRSSWRVNGLRKSNLENLKFLNSDFQLNVMEKWYFDHNMSQMWEMMPWPGEIYSEKRFFGSDVYQNK